jgi:peptide/nickel transport system ATP-binding protein
MHQGKLVEQGGADAIIGAPDHEYTRRLLSAVPRYRGRRAVSAM